MIYSLISFLVSSTIPVTVPFIREDSLCKSVFIFFKVCKWPLISFLRFPLVGVLSTFFEELDLDERKLGFAVLALVLLLGLFGN